ncbi:MAG: hypothetical protein ACMUIP_18045 [bacterium]
MGSISIQIPEELIIDALSHLTYEKRLEIIKKAGVDISLDVKYAKADLLDKLTSIVSIGGDAVTDTEMVFDE